jgi:high-affinity K+ transport system ATPase subunit B
MNLVIWLPATALAEARGEAQAESLRSARHDTAAYRVNATGAIEAVPSTVGAFGSDRCSNHQRSR